MEYSASRIPFQKQSGNSARAEKIFSNVLSAKASGTGKDADFLKSALEFLGQRTIVKNIPRKKYFSGYFFVRFLYTKLKKGLDK